MTGEMRISLIVAMDRRGTIGDDRGIPWRLPNDLKRFRKLTMGKPILMGRTTHEHIGRPLPGRTNIVLSRREGYEAPGCLVVKDLTEGLRLAREGGADEAVVIGGGQVYREAMSICDRVYLTRVEGIFPGNVSFPENFARVTEWWVVEEAFVTADAENPHASRFFILDRGAGSGRGLSEDERRLGFRLDL